MAHEAQLAMALQNDSHGTTDPFVAVVSATRMPVVITNPRLPDNPAVFVNDAFCRLTGYRRSDILGRNCRFLQGPATDKAAVARMRTAIASAQSIEIDLRNHRKDGSVFWNRVMLAPVRDDTGAVTYFFANQMDVTLERDRLVGLETHNAALLAELSDRLRAQEETEAQLRILTASLETQVAERTRSLVEAEASLRQSQKMDAIGQLTGGLAHDFNNLLAAISGSLQLMQVRISQGRVTDVERYIRVAQGATSRGAALTHRLLTFSRRQTLNPQPLNINRLVVSMEDLIRRTMGPEVHVNVAAASGLWNTLVDPGELENALLNLCINARDAMPDGGKLTIETANHRLDQQVAQGGETPPGQYIGLCISDTGIGIPPDHLGKVFDPFFTTKPSGQGSGLGLSMIYGFTRQSGGQARIQSELGKGTVVTLYLPRHSDTEPQGYTPPPLTARNVGGDETVLIVDDEPTVRLLMIDALEDLGYTTLEAESGVEALQILRSGMPVDMLIADVGLPGGINGRQLADVARDLHPSLPVLFVTGYAANEAVGFSPLAPGMHVMTKPFEMDALAMRVRDLLT